jgi:chromosome segregation ATPase
MPERISAPPAWAWIVGAVLVIVSIFIGYRVVQTQQHLAAAQSQLESAKQALASANAERKELQTKSDDALKSAQSQLAETQSLLEATRSEIESTKQAAEEANTERNETQTKLDDATSELRSTKRNAPKVRERSTP